jgi:predicted transcriptional regulator
MMVLGRSWTMPSAQETAKEQMIKILEGLPDESSYDALLEELVLSRMIKRGLADVDAGRTLSHDEMRRRIDSWAR